MQDSEGSVVSGQVRKSEDTLIAESYAGEVKFLQEVLAAERCEVDLDLVCLFLKFELFLPEYHKKIRVFLIGDGVNRNKRTSRQR